MNTLYEVTISHARSAPLRNVFRYRSYLWLVDLDHLPRVRLLAGFRARDHLGDPRASIRANLDRFLAARGVDLGGGRVTMLAHARVLGYVFNPLTVYWCHRPDGTLACVVAEVHNTYRQRHAYLLPAGQAEVPKRFYVSPFYPVDGRYRMSLPEPDANPGGRLSLSVRLDRPDGHSFAASVRGRAVPATRRELLAAAVRHPWSTAAVSARRNVGRHYDLSNGLFALFLDETMTYSAALFPERDGTPVAGDLAQAQRRKIDRLLDRAGVGPGCRLLEVGTGWGELAIRAARRGATVRTITVSREQQELAARRAAEAGLAGRVSVELRDYRDLDGRFDAICSAEMLEAVGERYWDAYFAALDRHLAPGGRIGLQTITMPHDRMLATRHTYTWIQKYVFPGGLLPSITAIGDSLARTTLRITGREDFGAHYAETLRIWRERFGAQAGEVARLGFDEVFNRMWTFYLCYSEAGFRAGYIDVSQLTLARP